MTRSAVPGAVPVVVVAAAVGRTRTLGINNGMWVQGDPRLLPDQVFPPLLPIFYLSVILIFLHVSI